MQTLAVIGAGAAGRSFALRCALAGLDVVLEDVMPERLRRAQDDYAALVSPDPASPGTGSLRLVTEVEDAVRTADAAIDFVPDELESKLEIFSLLDRMAPPKTILMTPTRVLSITDLASCTYRPGLCIGLRGDILLEGAVGVIRGRLADPAAVDSVATLMRRLGTTVEIVEDREEPMLVKNLAMRNGAHH
jgi:3-hydroxybutyryl-CoA dehydrogenase